MLLFLTINLKKELIITVVGANKNTWSYTATWHIVVTLCLCAMQVTNILFIKL